MKSIRLLHPIEFSALVAVPFLLSFFLLASFYGCSKEASKQAAAPVLVSVENLQIAYGKEVKYHHMYADFVTEAEKEHLANIAQRFRAIARSEEIHAKLHLDFLKAHGIEPRVPVIDSVTVGKTLQTLKMSISSEEIETESMYPNLIRTAELEKLAELSTQLTQIRAADIRHSELLQEVLDKSGKIVKSAYLVCSNCGYILAAPAGECPNCHAHGATLERVL